MSQLTPDNTSNTKAFTQKIRFGTAYCAYGQLFSGGCTVSCPPKTVELAIGLRIIWLSLKQLPQSPLITSMLKILLKNCGAAASVWLTTGLSCAY